MRDLTACFVGLPGAGKTTYLAALWAASRDPANGSFRVQRFPDPSTRAYLQRIADQWFAGQVVERNASGSWEPVELSLESESSREVHLRIPDLSGEAFRDLAAERTLDDRILELVRVSDVVLFFVNAATASTPVYLTDLDGEPPARHAGGADDDDFRPELLESDVLNAELLSLLPALHPTPERPAPLAVVVSAWDCAEITGMSPRDWLRNNQPMFAQVLAEYERAAPVTVIGVSAQGGDYERSPEVREADPHLRPLVVTDAGRSSDISAPLLWYETEGADDERP
jgi:hypothetical protein